jgi:hypothetical protein
VFIRDVHEEPVAWRVELKGLPVCRELNLHLGVGLPGAVLGEIGG